MLGDDIPVFVAPTDTPLDFHEPLQRLNEALETVDTDIPDVRLLSAHTAVTIAALLNDSDDLATQNDQLVASNRKLAAHADRLQRAIDRMNRKLNDALASGSELRTNLNAERRLRRRAEQARADTDRLGDTQPARASDEENARLYAQLQQAHADIDNLVVLAEAAENERDQEIQRRALLAIRLAVIEGDEPVEQELPPPASFGDVLTQAKHPLLVYTLDQSITDDLDRHPQAETWRRCATAALATMAAYAAAKAEARRPGQAPGPDLADLAAFTRSGHTQVQISPSRIALSESATVTGSTRLAQQRRFAVPQTVEATGAATMFAHIRLGRRPPAPRLHFLDRTDRPDDGKIYLGYLGPHLRTSTTN